MRIFTQFTKYLLIILFAASFAGNIATAEITDEIPIHRWLVSGILPIHDPVFDVLDAKETLLMAEIPITGLQPREKEKITLSPGTSFTWKKFDGPEAAFSSAGKSAAEVYLAAYITTKRRQTVDIRIETPFPASLYIDGSHEAMISTLGTDNAPNTLIASVDLHTGKHLMLIKSVKAEGPAEASWNFKGTVTPEFARETVIVSTDPTGLFSRYEDYAKFHDLDELVISNDGKKMAFVKSSRDNCEFKKKKWIEVRSAVSGSLLQQIKMQDYVTKPRFAPNGDETLFFTSDGFIWKIDLVSGEKVKVSGKLDGLVRYRLSPDAKFIYYTTDGERIVRGTDDYTLMTTLEERLTDWTDARQIKVLTIESGATREITSLRDSIAVDDFNLRPDGEKIIFTFRKIEKGRPYMYTQFEYYDVKSGKQREITKRRIPFETRPQNFTIIDENTMVYTSSSYFTDDSNADKHNLSEVDIWIMDLKTGETKNLTRDTPFTIDERAGTKNALFWNKRDRLLYFTVMIGGYKKLYRMDPNNPAEMEEVPTGHNLIGKIDLSDDGKTMVFTSESLESPKSAYSFNIKKKRAVLLHDPNEEFLKNFKMGTNERFDFKNKKGHQIDGWIFFPPDFNPTKRYPTIVYYYAGVWHMDEEFSFTFQFWLANGYVVYMLTPVGAMAHGDAFSDFHVNDWGTNATQDIIDGTKKLIAEKKFVDPERLGCYGGSYGGFTTMDLITKTKKMFKCAVSMYGISNLASYWGGGIWGYTYGDIALAKSYPWNRKGLFTDNSPLFNANKIEAPLLLLHGDSDVNVPALESDQMFTALKVLDKEVAYIKFNGEGHGIAGNFKNYIAHREMMLEWFDMYLKDQPEGWERRWK